MIYLRMIRLIRGILSRLRRGGGAARLPESRLRRGRILASRPSFPIDGGDSPPWLSFRRDGSGTACFPGRSHRKKKGGKNAPRLESPGFWRRPGTGFSADAACRYRTLSLRRSRFLSGIAPTGAAGEFSGRGRFCGGFPPGRRKPRGNFRKIRQIRTNKDKFTAISHPFPTLLRPFFDLFDRPLSHPVSPPFPHRRAHHPHQKYIPPGARPRTANAGWCAQMRARGGQMTGF